MILSAYAGRRCWAHGTVIRLRRQRGNAEVGTKGRTGPPGAEAQTEGASVFESVQTDETPPLGTASRTLRSLVLKSGVKADV